jgi:D-glycero-beta-D-manno-heptose 1-phosphate adenylyltransferase
MARNQIKEWKAKGERVVFTNGVFDILHVGHVTYLEAARALGDKLVVGLNSDASVRRLGKGDDRPVNPQEARKKVLEALRCVDAVEIFIEDTPLELIKALEPTVLVKGGDYDENCEDAGNPRFIVGSTEVKSRGGQVISIPIVPGFSTTSILKKIQKPGKGM